MGDGDVEFFHANIEGRPCEYDPPAIECEHYQTALKIVDGMESAGLELFGSEDIAALEQEARESARANLHAIAELGRLRGALTAARERGQNEGVAEERARVAAVLTDEATIDRVARDIVDRTFIEDDVVSVDTLTNAVINARPLVRHAIKSLRADLSDGAR